MTPNQVELVRRNWKQVEPIAETAAESMIAFVPGVQALGRRHAGYGVKDGHYATVAAALLWTLEQGFGEAFTAEIREAWTAAHVLLANTMNDASRLAA